MHSVKFSILYECVCVCACKELWFVVFVWVFEPNIQEVSMT
jgi:hypothetical protein